MLNFFLSTSRLNTTKKTVTIVTHNIGQHTYQGYGDRAAAGARWGRATETVSPHPPAPPSVPGCPSNPLWAEESGTAKDKPGMPVQTGQI